MTFRGSRSDEESHEAVINFKQEQEESVEAQNKLQRMKSDKTKLLYDDPP